MKKHITVRFAFVIGLVEILAMVALFFVMDFQITGKLEEQVVRDMNVIARDRAELVETYIQGCLDYVDEYSHMEEIRNVLKNPTDSAAVKAARDVTNEVAANHVDIEGLYVAKWDTYVLAHINPDSVDKTFRDAAGASELENQIRKAEAAFCTGVGQAPVTKKMVIPIYAPVKDESGAMIGFVGGAFYADTLNERLLSINGPSDSGVTYSLINDNTNTYIFDNDPQLAGTVCEDEVILDAIKALHTDINLNGYYNYTTSDKLVSCYHMANRDWIFVVRDESQDVFGIIGTVRLVMLAVCLVIAILVIVVTALTASRLMRPVRAISNQLTRLGTGDYSRGHTIEKYEKRPDEFGTIAKAALELQTVMEHQYELFLEILRVQTVGTLVTRGNNNEVVLINAKAMEFMNLRGDPDKVTIQHIRDEFDEDALALVDEKMTEVQEMVGNEVSYEVSIEDGARHRHLLTNAKHVLLSNGDDVIIMSLTDITDRKVLEDNLKILSETDPLTRICNRRSGEARIREMMAGGRFGMFCLFDIDDFKKVNDTYGHGAGDQVLMRIAEAMKRSFRTSDILIRLGGDEFVVFAVGMPDEKTGCIVIERFMEHIAQISIEEMDGKGVTISLGAMLVDDNEPFEQMYAKADSIMYKAKEETGNSYKFYHEGRK